MLRTGVAFVLAVAAAAGSALECRPLLGWQGPRAAVNIGARESSAPGPAPASAAYKPSNRERRDAERLVARFRRAKTDLAKKAQVVQEAATCGPYVVQAVFQALGQELYPQLERYRARFQQQASTIGKRQVGTANLDEIARLRAAVLSLSKAGNLTKEMLVQQADPAVNRLAEIFLVGRVEVLARSTQLQAERQRLQALGVLWQQCAAYLSQTLPPEARASDEPPRFNTYLDGEEELAVGLAVPMDPLTRQILAANARLAAQLDPEEARAVLALNLTRNLLGLAPLAIDPKLCAAARDHSKDMDTLKFFAHGSTVEGKGTPWDRAKRFGTTASAENIFAGVPDGRSAHLAWFHSPGHHKNQMADHKRVGVGRSGTYSTEMFGD